MSLINGSTRITELNIRNNNIGVEGAKKIADLLINDDNSTLLNVDLSNNNIGVEGIQALQKAFKKPGLTIEL